MEEDNRVISAERLQKKFFGNDETTTLLLTLREVRKLNRIDFTGNYIDR